MLEYYWHNNKRLIKKIIIVVSIIFCLIFLFIFTRNYIYSANTENNILKMVSGTEYISGEQGQVIVRLENSKNQGIDDAICKLSLLYPDKSYFLIDQTMLPTSIPGNYYFSFMTPAREGIYEEQIICSSEKNNFQNRYISSSFHVSTGLNLIVEVSRTQREIYNDLNAKITELNKKLENLDSNINQKITTIENNNYEIQQNITDVNNNVNNLNNNIDEKLNNKFENLNTKFKQTAESMANIFSN